MNRRTMMTTLAGGVVAVGYAGRATAEPVADEKMPVASAPAAKDFAGAKERPDSKTDYKVVFTVFAKVKDDEVPHPTLKSIGTYLNTLASNGVPAKHRHIAAMFDQGGGDAVFSNELCKARHNGVDNPNIAALKELQEAGVELHVCGQGLIGKKVEPSQLLPGVQADLWAMVTMVNLQSRGYVRVG